MYYNELQIRELCYSSLCTPWYKYDKPLTYTVFNTYLYNFVYINVFSDYFYIHVGYIM